MPGRGAAVYIWGSGSCDGHDGGPLVRSAAVPPGSRQGANTRRLPRSPQLQHGHEPGIRRRLRRPQWHLPGGLFQVLELERDCIYERRLLRVQTGKIDNVF